MKALLNKRIDDGNGILKYEKPIHCYCCERITSSYCIIDCNLLDKVVLCKTCLNIAISTIDKAIIDSIK